ncbi:Uncharacterized protein APZ42_029526 [Daphnia magna]|uniref:Uncharacterized protein n=1 Tax=Daphnia magna TaxID=35525 RepID=A0A164PMI6_9CRUS|nr:Uncharacterized protein APZ42_029526 [Daphnia magna]
MIIYITRESERFALMALARNGYIMDGPGTHTHIDPIDTAREIMIRMQPSVRPVGSVRCCAAFSETSMGVMCVCVCVCVKTIVITKQYVKMYRLTRRKERSICAEKELAESNST